MEFAEYFPVWDKLTEQQRQQVAGVVDDDSDGVACDAAGSVAVDIDLADGEIHEIELRDYFGGNTLFFIDGILVAEAVIADGTLTLTNAAGQQISRTGIVAADNAFKYKT